MTVNFALAGTATQGVDYLMPRISVTFEDGKKKTILEVEILDDLFIESDDTIELVLLPGSDYNIGSEGSAIRTILDNDALV